MVVMILFYAAVAAQSSLTAIIVHADSIEILKRMSQTLSIAIHIIIMAP